VLRRKLDALDDESARLDEAIAALSQELAALTSAAQ
jgi:prefoldin subunit 5